jgi:hypothetical protein
VPQRLDERPLAVDPLVQQSRFELLGSGDGLGPQSLDHVPRFPEPRGICRSQLQPLRMPPVEFRLDQWADVNAVDSHSRQLTADVHVPKQRAPDLHAAEVGVVEAGTNERHLLEGRAGEVDVVKPSTGETALRELIRHTKAP